MTLIEKARAFLGLVQESPIWPPTKLSLALQGGGSFGAFAWGVLDRLLEEPDIDFDAVSGASAGAINAVLLASGMIEGGREGARARLSQFWKRISRVGPRSRRFGAGLELVIRTAVPVSVQSVQSQSAARGADCRGRLRTLAEPIADQAPARRDTGARRQPSHPDQRGADASTPCSPRPACRFSSRHRDRRRTLLGRRIRRQSAALASRPRHRGGACPDRPDHADDFGTAADGPRARSPLGSNRSSSTPR